MGIRNGMHILLLMAWENICKPEMSKSKASSFNEIERGLFVYSSLVENMENQNLFPLECTIYH